MPAAAGALLAAPARLCQLVPAADSALLAPAQLLRRLLHSFCACVCSLLLDLSWLMQSCSVCSLLLGLSRLLHSCRSCSLPCPLVQRPACALLLGAVLQEDGQALI
jgi:hypothetical protein